ncbi:class I SAM-dependent methyltransferase [bacterium]|nr:class I SAM-dependent methyltransferase [bacterium]MBU1984930.1 class I SAM-dependent methyltransferase [bacterium]
MFDRLKRAVQSCPATERTARLLFDRRFQMARRNLRGIGIEIGALDRPLFLPWGTRAFYLDRLHPNELRRHYPELNHRSLYVSLIADGETMDCIRDNALNFIIANHVIEHCEDPIATLTMFTRKLLSGGRIFLAVPDKRRTFDRSRTETTWEHLVEDHIQGPAVSRLQHYREWAESVENLQGNAAQQRARELTAMDYSIHFHCWSESSFLDFLNRVRAFAPFALLDSCSWRDENIYVLECTNGPTPGRTS